MRVKFFTQWWDGERRWRPGVHDVPDHLFDSLPQSALIENGSKWSKRGSLDSMPKAARDSEPPSKPKPTKDLDL